MDIAIMQGDSYYLPIEIKIDGVYAELNDFDEIEIMIGSTIRKTLSNNSIVFDNEKKIFKVLLTQYNTLSLQGNQTIQIRAKLKTGEVIGNIIEEISIIPSLSKEVL